MSVLYLLCASLAQARGFTFGVSANFGIGASFNTTAAAAGASDLDFMMALGDFSDQPSTEPAWCQVWNDKNVSNLFLLAGTRETGENVGGNITQYIASCPLAFSSIVGDYGFQYYFDYPASSPFARFVFINPQIASGNYTVGSTSYTWLEGVLTSARSSGMNWIIVNMHKIFISAFPKIDEVDADVMNLLFAHRVDLIIQGHEEGYMRSKQLKCAYTSTYSSDCVVGNGSTLVGGNSTVLLVIGTGGQNPLGVFDGSNPEAEYFDSIQNSSFGFGRFSANLTYLHFDFVAGSGLFQDNFTIHKETVAPTNFPTNSPTTTAPSIAPTSFPTTVFPTTLVPTLAPSLAPTIAPSSEPTVLPSLAPTTLASLHSNETEPEAAHHGLNANDTKSMIIVTFVMVLLLFMFLSVIAAHYIRTLPVRPRTVTRTIESARSMGDKDGNSNSRKGTIAGRV